MTAVHARANDALGVNFSNADRNLTVNGSNWLWAVTAIMGLTFLGFLTWTISRNKLSKAGHSTNNHHGKKSPHRDGFVGDNSTSNSIASGFSKERVFNYLFTIAAFVAFISYFTMASNLGNTPIRQYMNSGADALQTRDVFYVRYIYYITAWPLVLTAVLLLSGVTWATILFIIALQEIWVVSWLCGALVTTSYKWGYYAFGLFAYIVLSYLLLTWGIKQSEYIRTKKTYSLLAGLLVIAWALYPIAWGLSEGSNRLSVTGENVFYGILDIVAIPIFGNMFLYLVSKRVGPEIARFTQTGRIHDLAEYGSSHGHSTGHAGGHNDRMANDGQSSGLAGRENTGLNSGHNHDHSGAPAVSGNQV